MTQDESTPVRCIGSSVSIAISKRANGTGTPGDGEGGFGPRVRVATRLDREEAFEAIVARGPAMRRLLERVQRAAQSDSPLVLEGEPGCGKRVLAKLAHELSSRSEMPFVRVDCAAHSDDFIEGELFGVRRGGEVRAVRDREGLVQTAHRGTLLLENPCELPDAVQAKLQEFLATDEFRPVGDRWGTRCVDVRVIVSSTVPLEVAAAQGRLRRALCDRLSVLVLSVPSLRERVEDIEPLFEHFAGTLREVASHADRPTFSIDVEARAWLRAYPWPGNVRELQNAVEYACTMGSRERLRCEDLPGAIRRYAHPDPTAASGVLTDVDPHLDDAAVERERIERTLVLTEGDVDRSARLLGMSRRGLRYAIAHYGIEARTGEAAEEPRVPGERLRAALQRHSSKA